MTINQRISRSIFAGNAIKRESVYARRRKEWLIGVSIGKRSYSVVERGKGLADSIPLLLAEVISEGFHVDVVGRTSLQVLLYEVYMGAFLNWVPVICNYRF